MILRGNVKKIMVVRQTTKKVSLYVPNAASHCQLRTGLNIKCDCGNKTVVNGCDLRNGTVFSCGCLTSLGEQQILQLLQSKNIPYKKEYCFTDLVSEKGGHPRFDFALFNENGLVCLIEYQGSQHFIDKGEFGLVQRESTDKLKREYCLSNNIPLYEIRYDEPLERTLLYILEKEKYL